MDAWHGLGLWTEGCSVYWAKCSQLEGTPSGLQVYFGLMFNPSFGLLNGLA